MKSLRSFLLFVPVICLLNGTSAFAEKDYLAFFKDGSVKIKGKFDGETYFSSADASTAFQYALDRFKAEGGTLEIGSGSFLLKKPLILFDNTHIRGCGRATKLLVDTDNGEGIGIICKDAKGVMISHMTVSAGQNPDAKTGIIIDNSGEVKVQRVFSVGFSAYGLWMRNNSFLCEISSCSFAGNEKSNLYLENLNWGKYGNFIPNLISDCTIYGGGKGIECNYVIVLNIVACNIYQTREVGIHIYKMSNSILVNSCRTFQISSDAMVVEGSHELNVTGNIFCWSTGDGIVVRDAAWGTISANNIIDNGSINPGGVNFQSNFEDIEEDIPLKNGISLYSVRGFNISNNTIFNWELAPKMKYGIYEDETSFNNIIEGNNINYYMEAGVLSEGTGTLVTNNKGLDNATYFEIKDINDMKSILGIYRPGTVQSFQPELTEEWIDSLK